MSVTTILSYTFDNPVLADLDSRWTDQRTSLGSLASAVTTSSSTLPVLVNPSLSAAVTPGKAILIGSEAMLVTDVTAGATINDPSTLTVTRGATVATLAIPAAHTSGSTVYLLTYASPVQMLSTECVLPYIRKVSTDLGDRSSVFAYTVSWQTAINS